MPSTVFDRICNSIIGKGTFVHRKDRLSKLSIHPLQRITAALRILAYGIAAVALDEYLQMSEDCIILSMKEFCKAIFTEFEEQYLRGPNEDDLRRIMSINEARGFPGCIGSIDCQHWS